ncbi:Hypothetical predicted protein, partial [Olea europaea subsp. europaea]
VQFLEICFSIVPWGVHQAKKKQHQRETTMKKKKKKKKKKKNGVNSENSILVSTHLKVL